MSLLYMQFWKQAIIIFCLVCFQYFTKQLIFQHVTFISAVLMQNLWFVEIGRDLKRLFIQPSCFKQDYLEQVAQDCVQ